jgi:hemolysin activation/secretion protein
MRYLVGRHGLDVTLQGVTTADAPPVQYLADIGGLSTVRGYDRRFHVGDHSFAARVEYPVPYDLFALSRIPLLRNAKIQWAPWFDAGRVDDGDSNNWITSAGVGLQRYIGPFGKAANLRLDVAFPFDSQADDYVFYLWFVALR